MAEKKSKKKGAKEKVAKARRPKGKKGELRLGPRYEKLVRVPINATQYNKKESEIAQLEIVVAKLQRKIKPEQNEIRAHRKKIGALTLDLEENTEERKMFVRNEYNDITNNVRVLRGDNGACVEERTMSEDDRQIDLEDEHTTVVTSDADPAETPTGAIAAAREDDEADEDTE